MKPNPVNEALNTIRAALEISKTQAATPRQSVEAMTALDTLLWSLQPNPMLHVQAEAFCSEVEQVAAHREQQDKGGQHVPCHSSLTSTGPGAFTALERYAREFRAALGKKPHAPRCSYFTTSGTCCHPENPDRGSVAVNPATPVDDTCPHCKGSGWENEELAPDTCSWCEGTKRWRPD